MRKKEKLEAALWLAAAALTVFLFGFGGTINYAVVAANHGMMPVVAPICAQSPGEEIDDNHVCASASSRLLWAADRFPSGHYIESIGDISLDLGERLSFLVAGLILFRLSVHIALLERS